MPANYAHFRFGGLVLEGLPADLRRPILGNRRLYDVGLHGPDIFFYYNPFSRDNLGSKFHRQSGHEFFTRVCKRLRLNPSDGGKAYLFGVLAHYCLDSLCHPFVKEVSAEGIIGHVELETEFDRYLLELDGKLPPWAQDTTRHLKLPKADCDCVAPFYPGASPLQIRNSVHRMAFLSRLLIAPGSVKRTLLSKTLSGKNRQFLMEKDPNPNCAHLCPPLLSLFEKAQALYPMLADEITAHLAHNAPLSDRFSPNFG